VAVDDTDIEQSQIKSFDNICAGPSNSVFKPTGGGFQQQEVDAITQDKMDDEASFQPQGGLFTRQQEALLP